MPDFSVSKILTSRKRNTCQSALNAVLAKDLRNNGKKYAVSGSGVALCGRHSMVLPHGAVDLQRGERCVVYNLNAARALIMSQVH
jgi:hypothetical protein